MSKPDPKKGTGKKPKGSGRRLYTDENPKDTVSIKFATPAAYICFLLFAIPPYIISGFFLGIGILGLGLGFGAFAPPIAASISP